VVQDSCFQEVACTHPKAFKAFQDFKAFKARVVRRQILEVLQYLWVDLCPDRCHEGRMLCTLPTSLPTDALGCCTCRNFTQTIPGWQECLLQMRANKQDNGILEHAAPMCLPHTPRSHAIFNAAGASHPAREHDGNATRRLPSCPVLLPLLQLPLRHGTRMHVHEHMPRRAPWMCP
jgi:hypothetical protein